MGLELGKLLVLNKCFTLAEQMVGVKIGTRIRVTYAGLGVLSHGVHEGKPYHEISVTKLKDSVFQKLKNWLIQKLSN
jgi:hypothetical protein